MARPHICKHEQQGTSRRLPFLHRENCCDILRESVLQSDRANQGRWLARRSIDHSALGIVHFSLQ
jgi:hypothetical protein